MVITHNLRQAICLTANVIRHDFSFHSLKLLKSAGGTSERQIGTAQTQ